MNKTPKYVILDRLCKGYGLPKPEYFEGVKKSQFIADRWACMIKIGEDYYRTEYAYGTKKAAKNGCAQLALDGINKKLHSH